MNNINNLSKFVQQKPLEITILGLLSIMYIPLLWYWVDGWLNKTINTEHEYFSHGLIGIPFAVYIVWTNRQKWEEISDRTHFLSIIFLGLGAIFYHTGLRDWVNLSLPMIITGICLFFKGMEGLKLQLFPLTLLWLATPNQIPYLIAPYTLPLQEFIAASAGFILIQFGLNVTVQQIYLFVGGRIVEVAPFCAGLKMLFTDLYVSMMLLYWTDAWRSRLKTNLLLIGAVIISVIGNIVRNSLLTYFHGTGNDKMYSACQLGLILLLLEVLQKYLPKNSSTSD
jgi:cyanoexosortase B